MIPCIRQVHNDICQPLAVFRRGKICLLDIDVQGVKAVKASSLRPKYVFIAPPSLEVKNPKSFFFFRFSLAIAPVL